ncbi:radical SAM family heme chaperone HemW [Brachyspira pilosicoli]|uniref:Heme chaperone HemW n=1 Tax=Brachyspira pilosicoli TaxID=52584 RepID=A0AAJ6KBY5_BRAPL|nr:radical SAM family heme chaperone HemW [Brachyspira pilosicoli]WIH90311.1 radical SAM family heme chaperone HemW [Brachyspira pilosicoli]WIH92602.1 radical SAM family heme chaperone HemW [Brachyspira pilosicoli]WIH94892.1 radical SAM family heme chaperone HemW [Brachyspira pilosicoli]
MSGLYIHIPFCTYKCSYCNFFSVVNMNEKEIYKNYADALIEELKLRIDDYNEEINTIYFGGGTPSVLNANLLKYLLDNILNILKNYQDIKLIKEITIESNINDINSEYINFLESIDNIRISLGLQTFNEKSLSLINRHTELKEIVNALKIINNSTIENISLDFISGLPLNDKLQTKKDILKALELLPKTKHISLYYLELTKSLEEKWRDYLPKEEESVEYYEISSNTLKDLGFIRYEISNYSINNYESIHNSNYWKLKNYLGLGASAVGYYNRERYENIKNVKTYIEHIKQNKKPIKEIEYIDRETQKKEFIFLSLRTVKGININNYNKMFKEDFKDKYSSIIKNNKNYFLITDEYLSIKENYFNYADEISLLFL